MLRVFTAATAIGVLRPGRKPKVLLQTHEFEKIEIGSGIGMIVLLMLCGKGPGRPANAP